MNNNQLSALLDKYLKGECSPEEISAIENWYFYYETNDDFIDTLTSSEQNDLKLKMFNKIERAEVKQTVSLKKRRLYHLPVFRIAAAVTIVLIAVTYFWIGKSDATKMVNVSNGSKIIQKQILPDKSIAYLSPGASLSYPEVFDKHLRSVSMQGECFFEVTKNPAQPFIISSPRIVTKVWGTSFRVYDDRRLGNASVTVLSGKVSVSKNENLSSQKKADVNENEIMIYPSQQVSLSASRLELVKEEKPNISGLAIYNHVDLSFKGEKLSKIVKVLSQTFSTSIDIADEEIAGSKMDADLTELNLPEILDILGTSLNVKYEIVGERIILKKK